jgi:hypothetical protein
VFPEPLLLPPLEPQAATTSAKPARARATTVPFFNSFPWLCPVFD